MKNLTGKLDFTGKRILVTGASSGIGRATSVLLDELGAHLHLVDMNNYGLADTFSMMKNSWHILHTADLQNIAVIEPLVSSIVKEYAPLDGFVHCAGIGEYRPIGLSKYDFMLKVMNINFFSFVEFVRCITKKKYFNPELKIVGISALGAFLGNSTKTAYSSSKAAMNAAVRCLAKELAPKNIRINTVAPGVTQTPMLEQFESRSGEGTALGKIIERQYLGICLPEDIAESVVFLLSDLSRMITGSCLSVDGGKLTS